MKVTTWHDDVSLPHMNEWLAELRDDHEAEPPGADTPPAQGVTPPAFPAPAVIPGQRRTFGPATDAPWADVPAPGDALPPGDAPASADTPASADAGAPMAGFAAPAGDAAPVTSAPPPAAAAAPAAPAPIGDELRRPMMWCEMPSCISHHADPAALGEADARARAVRAGWRFDAVGRLVCPHCQQTTDFWAPRPVVPWDRATALVMTTLAAVRARRVGGRLPEQQAWHHEQPWVRGGRHARTTPARPYISPA